MPRKPSLLVVCFLLLAATALVFSSCSREGSVSSPTSGSTSATSLSPRNSNDVALTMRIQNAHTPDLMKIPDVVGTGTGVGSDGKLAVLVLTRHSGVAGIPGNLDGIKTDVRVVGDVIPYAPPGSGGIQAGNSVGNDRECAAGTIGAVVLK